MVLGEVILLGMGLMPVMAVLEVVVQVWRLSQVVCILPMHLPLEQSTGLQLPARGLLQEAQAGISLVLEETVAWEAMAMMALWKSVMSSWLYLAREMKWSCRTFLTNQVAAGLRSGMIAPDCTMMCRLVLYTCTTSSLGTSWHMNSSTTFRDCSLVCLSSCCVASIMVKE